MVAQAFRDVETRHRLLESFLLRLANDPDVDAFALRGGMLVRHWFPTAGRPARDIDLVCSLPFDVEDMRRRMATLLGGVDASVTFEPERFRLDVLRPDSRHPGMRLFAAGQVDGWSAEMSVDVTFRLDVWPDAQQASIQTERGSGKLWTCQPEMLIGRKLQVIAELGHRHWRPKDLADIWLMLQQFQANTGVLGEAVERSFHGEPVQHQLADIFGQHSFWSESRSAARWARFSREWGNARRKSPPTRDRVPSQLESVVDEVRSRLTPILRST